MSNTNTPEKTINKRQEQFNNILVSLILKTTKVSQLLSQLLDANNYGDTYMFEDYDVITDSQFKLVQDALVGAIELLAKQNVNLMNKVSGPRKENNGN
nr:MAG: hypothetical protein [Microvirus Sku211]